MPLLPYHLPQPRTYSSITGAIVHPVRFAYNEDCNVIVTVTGRASQIRRSEFFCEFAAVSCVQIDGSEQDLGMQRGKNEG